MAIRFRIAPICALLVVLSSGAVGAASDGVIELPGVRRATLSWNSAPGPVVGYYVIVTRNGKPPSVEGISLDTVETIEGEFGDTFVVQTAAFGEDGLPGPLSPPSNPVQFVRQSEEDPEQETDPGPSVDGSETPSEESDEARPRVPHDFTGDGRSDILLRFADTGELRLWAMDGTRVTHEQALPFLSTNWNIADTGDYDGDGLADLLWRESGSGALALWPLQDGAVKQAHIAGASLDPAWRLIGSGDFDGDGRFDLLFFHGEQHMVEFWTLRDGTLISLGRLLGGPSRQPLAIGDFDGDERGDLLWFNETAGAFEIWLMDGTRAVRSFSISSPAETGWEVQGAGDYDGDGLDDLLLQHAVTGRAEFWAFQDDALARVIPLPEAAGSGATGRGDYDGNGQTDVLWYGDESRISIWLLAGDDVLDTPMLTAGLTVVNPSPLASLAPIGFCPGDFNLDGRIDAQDYMEHFVPCLNQNPEGACSAMDLNTDGFVDALDFEVFAPLYQRGGCEAESS